MPNAKLKVELVDVKYDGQYLGPIAWDSDIDCTVSNGIPVATFRAPGLNIPHMGTVAVNQIIYPPGPPPGAPPDPGGFCSIGGPPGDVKFNVAVHGVPPDNALGGSNVGTILLPALPVGQINNQELKIMVKVPAPPTNPGNGADLWFRFFVGSTC
jgi:hypothetical protein